jgi:hypothetical protein
MTYTPRQKLGVIVAGSLIGWALVIVVVRLLAVR